MNSTTIDVDLVTWTSTVATTRSDLRLAPSDLWLDLLPIQLTCYQFWWAPFTYYIEWVWPKNILGFAFIRHLKWILVQEPRISVWPLGRGSDSNRRKDSVSLWKLQIKVSSTVWQGSTLKRTLESKRIITKVNHKHFRVNELGFLI